MPFNLSRIIGQNKSPTPYNIIIYNEFGRKINTSINEKPEQIFAYKYIHEDDIVLELGARYGSVSCVINKRLKNKKNQLSVEPDSTVWKALENNIKINNCEIQLFKGIISKETYSLSLAGYGTTAVKTTSSNIQSLDLYEIEKIYNLKFNTLVADCEGFLESFLDEYPFLYDQLYKIIFEADYPDKCNYNKIRNILLDKGFKAFETGFQNVYIKHK